MSTKDRTLAVAAFLDSPHAVKLAPKARDAAKHSVESFLTCCYDRLGKAPKHLDGHDAHHVLGHLLPEFFAVGDPRAPHVPDALRAYLDHLEETEVVTGAFELRQGFEATVPEFLEVVETGQAAHHHAPKADPVVYGAPKLGRNDPCSCGSGKKYKKCHGKKGG